MKRALLCGAGVVCFVLVNGAVASAFPPYGFVYYATAIVSGLAFGAYVMWLVVER